MESGLSFLWMLIQTLIALAVVCGLAYLLFRIVLPRFTFTGSANSMVRIVDRVSIDARKSLLIVEVADKWLLIAVSDNGVQTVAELDAAAAKAAEAAAGEGRGGGAVVPEAFSEKLSGLMGKKRAQK